MANNNLKGTLPANIGALSKMQMFAIDIFNHLTGSLPSSLGNMTSMALFTIAGSPQKGLADDFNGSIPDSLCNWKNIYVFHAGKKKNN